MFPFSAMGEYPYYLSSIKYTLAVKSFCYVTIRDLFGKTFQNFSHFNSIFIWLFEFLYSSITDESVVDGNGRLTYKMFSLVSVTSSFIFTHHVVCQKNHHLRNTKTQGCEKLQISIEMIYILYILLSSGFMASQSSYLLFWFTR